MRRTAPEALKPTRVPEGKERLTSPPSSRIPEVSFPWALAWGEAAAVQDAVFRWAPLFAPIEADRFKKGGGGTDIGPLMAKGVPGLGLNVNHQRYFDYHHAATDTIEAVNERELELGAIAMAIMSYLIAEEGLPVSTPPAK